MSKNKKPPDDGGLVILGDYKKGYIVMQSFSKNYKICKPFRYSVTLSKVI
jgi:hypothetical protein